MPLDDAELSRRLDEMPVMEPPADLRTSIMDGVRGSQLTVRSFPRRRAIFAAGRAAAAILVLVFLVAFPLRHEPADVVGTMAPKWPLVDRYGNERATLIVHKRGDFYAKQEQLQVGFLSVLTNNRLPEEYWSDARREVAVRTAQAFGDRA